MPPKKTGGKNEDAEFDQLLKQLSKATAAKGKQEAASRKDEPKHLSAAERKAAHAERERAKERESEEKMAKSLEARAQQKKLQEMIREMMKGGGMGGGLGGMGMGSPFLEAPNTTIETSSVAAKDSKVIAGCASMQGWRRNMEDAHIMYPNFRKASAKGEEDWHLYAVMDGHGGDVVAKTVKILLPALLHKEIEAAAGVPKKECFEKAFSAADAALKKKHGEDATMCGSTCVSVLVGAKQVVCASVGDSRAVLARKAGTEGDVVALADDHKPENPLERKRIEEAKGHVENNRVNGNLAMSRALGDFTYKTVEGKAEHEQQVICVPDVVSAERKVDDEFLIVACDGIFDVLTNHELVEAVRKEVAGLGVSPTARLTAAQLETVAGNITKHCLAPPAPEGGRGPARAEGTDNMSIIVVQL